MDEKGTVEQTATEKLISDIKYARVQLNIIMNTILKTQRKSRALSLIFTNAELTRSWFGKVLGSLGNPYPYKDSNDPSNTTIAPMEDASDEFFTILGTEDEIKFLKTMRKDLITSLLLLAKQALSLHGVGDSHWRKAFNVETYTENLSIAFGLRLAEIRDTKVSTAPPPPVADQPPPATDPLKDLGV